MSQRIFQKYPASNPVLLLATMTATSQIVGLSCNFHKGVVLTTVALADYYGALFNNSTALNTSTRDASYRRSDVALAVFYNTTMPIATYKFWVNGTTLISLSAASTYYPRVWGPKNPPISSFPYARLVSTTPPGSKVFYIYHQVSTSILAEDA